MYKAYKYRIYPTSEQETLLSKSFGCARWFWNYALNLCQETYRNYPQNVKFDGDYIKNHNLAKAVHDVGWGMFCTMLKYNAEGEGKQYIEIERWFPSSKTCHVCLNRVDNLSLDVRVWTCKHCGTHHDRDVNAAINIRNEALRILALGTSASACGGGVSRTGKTSVLLLRYPH